MCLECDTLDPSKLAAAFGASCPVASAIPLSVAILNQSPNYTDAIRINIEAGGDSAGRGILIGSILGANEGIGGDRGIPLSWITRLSDIGVITDALDKL